MGVKKEGDTTTQVVVMRRSVLKFFLPWLDEQLTAEKR
jgi:hypothetical protein